MEQGPIAEWKRAHGLVPAKLLRPRRGTARAGVHGRAGEASAVTRLLHAARGVVRKSPSFLVPCLYQKPSSYLDRLGTNIGKANLKRLAFLCRDMSTFAPIFDVQTIVRAGAAMRAALAAAKREDDLDHAAATTTTTAADAAVVGGVGDGTGAKNASFEPFYT